MPATWNGLKTGSVVGTCLSPIIDISSIRKIQSAIATIVADVPSGTSLLVQSNVSLDGTNWQGWKTVTSGVALSDLVAGSTAKKIQFKYTLTSNALATPAVYNLTLDLQSAFLSGEWVSNPIDLPEYIPQETAFAHWEQVTNGGIITAYTRHRMNVEDDWTEWVSQDNNGALSSLSAAQLQYKFVLVPAVASDIPPMVTSMYLSTPFSVRKGTWTSEMIDVSQTLDKTSGKVVVQGSASGGRIIVYSRSSTTSGGTKSAWCVALSDGTLTHPANNFVQIKVHMSGVPMISEITVSFDGSPTASLILSGMAPDADYDFATLKDTLVIVNGTDEPKKWDAVNDISNLGTGIPVLRMVETHQNRLWGVEKDNPSRVRFSDILDPTTWGVLNFIDFNPEDGDQITALYRYGQSMIVSKARSMAMVTGNTSSNYSVVWLDSEQGCCGMYGMCQADKYLAYIAQDGIRFTDLNNSVIATERLLPNWEEVNHRRLNQAALVYWRHYLIVALPSADSLHNDLIWIYDFLRNAWHLNTGWTISRFTKFNQYGGDVLLGADSIKGQVYELLVSEYDDDVVIEYLYQTKDFDFGYPERYKVFRGIYLDLEGISDESTLVVDLIVDNVKVGTFTTTLPAGEDIKHTRRILPPLYGAVLGRSLSLKIKGRCGLQKITIEYITRGVVPTEEL